MLLSAEQLSVYEADVREIRNIRPRSGMVSSPTIRRQIRQFSRYAARVSSSVSERIVLNLCTHAHPSRCVYPVYMHAEKG